MYVILRKILPICRDRGEEERAKRYEDISEKLKGHLILMHGMADGIKEHLWIVEMP